jgi:chromosome segregation ATPase
MPRRGTGRKRSVEKIADAYEKVRELENKLLDFSNQLARSTHAFQRADSERQTYFDELTRARKELAQHRSRDRLSDAELVGLAAVVQAQNVQTPATAERTRLEVELHMRGVTVEIAATKTSTAVFGTGPICGGCGESITDWRTIRYNGSLAFHVHCMPKEAG